MKVSWTKGLDPDLVKEIRGDFASSRVTRHRLIKMLEDDIRSARKIANTSDYDISNWSLKQADLIGYIRGLEHVISLIKEN